MRPERSASDAANDSRIAHVTLRGTAWSLASRLLGKGMVLISTIILARLLGKDDFGVAAYAISLIAVFSTLPALGLGPALIVHGRDDEKVLSTGFWLGLAAGVIGFAVVWTLAPLSASIFGDDRAVAVTRMLGLVFPIESLRNTHASVLSQRLAFRKRMGPELVQSLAKGLGSIGLALAGWGAMALIGGTLVGAAVSVPAYWIVSGWRPRFQLDPASARRLVAYGSPLVGTGVLGAIIRNLDYLVIGRLLGAAALGLYVLGFRLPDLLVRQLCQVLSQVLLPVYARFGSDRRAVARACTATLAYVFAITAPMSIGIALVAAPTVDLLFGPEWHEAAGVVAPIAIYTLFVSISFNVGDAFKACDRPDVLLRLSLLRGLIALPALTGAAYGFGSPTAVGWAQALVALVAVVATLVAARAVFGLSIWDALRGLLPIAASCAVMSIGVALALHATSGEESWVQLAVAMPIGMVSYLGSLRLLAPSFFESGLQTLRGALTRGPKLTAEVAP